ncbi:MAG: hypothetical protein LUD19_03040 [Clostridia bacterium]|nr:hypothetical protein [Clostridia bacterium]
MSKYTAQDILSYDNVPIAVAADYLGAPPDRLRRIIRSGEYPFIGVATSTADKCMFIISPGGLVRFKTGTLLTTSADT